MNEERFAYKPGLIIAIFCLLFFGVIAYFMGQHAYENDRGLILNKVIEFSVFGATIFYWVLAVSSALLSLLGLVLLISSLTSDRELVLTESYIQAPKSGVSKKIITVNFTDIKNITIQKVQKNLFLNIHHKDGKLTIVSNLLPKKADFEYIKDYIVRRANC